MAVYTHDIAAEIVELFEDVLDKYNIKVPSPEDDERGDDNDAKLYGSEYYDLLDQVEWIVLEATGRTSEGEQIVPYMFSGTTWQ